ncbi:helix-turn-helix domain-containing protein [Myceligenerans sp. I2]|uniref:Helix-turn-helix domain-containing protein n=1 Tax=Myceligenerans indicum TaxID=2593663 RepID=A0ABS1LN28_9MICO|nr:helix-turn-helix domain-containing protein [Myceligenerans indicum]
MAICQGVREIARALGREPGTVSRELRRNTPQGHVTGDVVLGERPAEAADGAVPGSRTPSSRHPARSWEANLAARRSPSDSAFASASLRCETRSF